MEEGLFRQSRGQCAKAGRLHVGVDAEEVSCVLSSAALGKVEDVTVHRDDRPDSQAAQADAPADITIQVYSQGNIVSQETGMLATLRRTIGQGAAAWIITSSDDRS